MSKRRFRDTFSDSGSNEDVDNKHWAYSDGSKTDGWQTDDHSDFTQDEFEDDDTSNSDDEEKTDEAKANRELRHFQRQVEKLEAAKQRRAQRKGEDIKKVTKTQLQAPGIATLFRNPRKRFTPLSKK